ncbi:MAG: hypothetical protein ACOC2C_03800 [Cyclonatronaceae bacterium]
MSTSPSDSSGTRQAALSQPLADSFHSGLEALASSIPLRREERSKKLLSVIDRILEATGGCAFLYEHIPQLVQAGIFEGSMWSEADKLVPSLVGGTLKAGGPTSIMEILSELRMLSIWKKRLQDDDFSPEQAFTFLKTTMVSNLDLIFPDGSEELRGLDENTRAKLNQLFSFLLQHVTLGHIRERLAEEIEEICSQRPIVTDRVKHILRTIEREIPLDDARASDITLQKYIHAAFRPTPAAEARSPKEYAAFLEQAKAAALWQEARDSGTLMQQTGLVSPYNVALIRHVSKDPDLLKAALGLDEGGRAELDKHHRFVKELIDEVIVAETARSCYGLAQLLNRSLMSHQPVKSGLQRLLSADLHPDTAAALRTSRPKASIKPVYVLVAECLGVLGQPLGIGQGWNPTCQSARGISLWSRHAPGKLLRMVETAARTHDLTMRFEAQLLTASSLSLGLAKTFDYNLDAVSVVLVPHLDKIYNRMMELASYRLEDPHKWVNPAMYGHWIPVGFMSAYDYMSNSIKNYERFIRSFYVTHHPEYNGGYNLAYPNPVGIFLTGANGDLLGFHAVSILRIARHEGEMRLYFLNPNNEGRQQWQSDIRPTVSGHGERPGESSLPFHQFASRMYAFHYSPSDLNELSSVDDAEVSRVMQIAKESWGTSYTWTDGLPAL